MSAGMMSFPKSCAVGRAASASSALGQRLGFEDVDAHRSQRQVGRSGNRRPFVRLFLEAGDPIFFVHGDDAESVRLRHRHLDGGQRHDGVSFFVEPQHARIVHLVDVVARQHDDVPRLLAQDRVEVLIHRVGSPLVPVLADALLWREDFDEFAKFFGDHAPAHADVAIERQRLVLGGDENVSESRVDAIAEGEVDDAVRAPEVDGRLRAVFGQRVQPLACAAGENDDEAVVERRGHDRSALPQRVRAVAARDPLRRSRRNGVFPG